MNAFGVYVLAYLSFRCVPECPSQAYVVSIVSYTVLWYILVLAHGFSIREHECNFTTGCYIYLLSFFSCHWYRVHTMSMMFRVLYVIIPPNNLT